MAAVNAPQQESYSDDNDSLTSPELGANYENIDDSYNETENADDNQYKIESITNIHWTGYGKRIPVILFNTAAFFNERRHFKANGEQYHLTFKFASSDCKIIRTILLSHGFLEVKSSSQEYNLTWSNVHPKPGAFRFMTHFQKINHFPRSYELTRKDRLFKNIQRMQQIKGYRHFDFIPASFILPGEYEEFCSSFLKNRELYIVKPVASCQGKGVYIVTHPDQVPSDENLIVSKYISSPLVINGFKFDVRVYVTVTSFDPLVIYLYEEGLTRIATVRYQKDTKYINTQCMHLTNFSVNKRSQNYVKNDDPDVENHGNKWSMGALLRYLKMEGKDTAVLMMQIESVIIKTILSAESSIAAACKMYQPYRGNCFELYGFDILIDQTLKPWVLEVNFSPSLACDTPLDLKIKSHMLCDLFSLVGIVGHDPSLKSQIKATRNAQDVTSRMRSHLTSCSILTAASADNSGDSLPMTGLNSEEIKILRRVKEEESRKGGWVRIFPNVDSWSIFGSFMQFPGSHNLMLHQRLFSNGPTEVAVSKGCAPISGSKSKIQLLNDENSKGRREKFDESYTRALTRVKQYERQLQPLMRSSKQTWPVRIKSKIELGFQGLPETDTSEDNEGGEDDMSERAEDTKLDLQERRMRGFISGKGNRKLATFTNEHYQENLSRNLQARMQSAVLEEPHKFERENIPSKMDANDIRENQKILSSRIDVLGFLQSGFTLSEVQARTTYTMYLKRVQERLLSNWSTFLQEKGVKAVNEQMTVMIKFLKCAAKNLPSSVRIVIPSSKWPLKDMKVILAKQLGLFIDFYYKETEQMKLMYKNGEIELEESEHLNSLDEHVFEDFITTAQEDALEAALMIYTKNNKCQTVFMGMDLRLTNGTVPPDKRELLPCCRSNLTFRGNPVPTKTVDDVIGVGQACKLHTEKTSRVTAHGKHGHGSARCHYSSPSSCPSAFAVYSQKLTRPMSATCSRTVHKGNLGMTSMNDHRLDTKQTSHSTCRLRGRSMCSEMTSSKTLRTHQRVVTESQSCHNDLIPQLRYDSATKKLTKGHSFNSYMTSN